MQEINKMFTRSPKYSPATGHCEHDFKRLCEQVGHLHGVVVLVGLDVQLAAGGEVIRLLQFTLQPIVLKSL